ncbi:MAG TPA: carbon-nitrogen hydrolase family protein [Dehalococcoidia bacterium]|nr:carbon-nitrogen hydrolase family protein [Dehalococcoidia bacterium]
MKHLRISLLHLAPVLGDIQGNRKLVELAVGVAAEQGADWVVTPELCISGYLFDEKIGTDWILPQPDPWMAAFCQQVKGSPMTVFLSHPDRDPQTQKLYNTVFVIDPTGKIIGQHSKVKTLRGPEGWSSPGTECIPVNCNGVAVGILVCADSYKNDVPQALKDMGADILVSPASWGPGGCGPDGEWEQRTLDTGLPIIVCNRSGVERDDLDFREAESVVAREGERLLTATSASSVVLTFDWDLDAMTSMSPDFRRIYL